MRTASAAGGVTGSRDPATGEVRATYLYGGGSPIGADVWLYPGCGYGATVSVDTDDRYEISGCRARLGSNGVFEVGHAGSNAVPYYGADAGSSSVGVLQEAVFGERAARIREALG